MSEGVVLETLKSFKRDKIPGSNGWPIEFFVDLFDILGDDITRDVEEISTSTFIPSPINSTFLAIIPKIDNPMYFNDFRPIYLCNGVCKIVAKIIAVRIDPYLSCDISQELFNFLKSHTIHEAIRFS